MGHRFLPGRKGQAGLVVFHLGIGGLVNLPYCTEVIIGHGLPETDFLRGYGGKVFLQGFYRCNSGGIQRRGNIYGTNRPHIERVGKKNPHPVPCFHFHALRELVVRFPIQLQGQYHLYVTRSAHKSYKYNKNSNISTVVELCGTTLGEAVFFPYFCKLNVKRVWAKS
jgi:hypothetical protein